MVQSKSSFALSNCFFLIQGVEVSASELDKTSTGVEDLPATDVEDSPESQLQDNSTTVQKNSTHVFINCSRTEDITPEVEVILHVLRRETINTDSA